MAVPRVEPVGNALCDFLGRQSLHDSPRRFLEVLVLDLEHDLRDQLAHQGVDVRVLVLAGDLIPQSLERLLHDRDSCSPASARPA